MKKLIITAVIAFALIGAFNVFSSAVELGSTLKNRSNVALTIGN